jgi:hypothetical protein
LSAASRWSSGMTDSAVIDDRNRNTPAASSEASPLGHPHHQEGQRNED